MTKGPRKILPLILLLLMSFGGNSCSFNELYVIDDPTSPVSNGSLAVISGTDEEVDIMLARYLTTELKKHSKLRILSQNDIRSKTPGYPFEIVDARNMKDDNPANIYPAIKAKLNGIQKNLRFDYAFVVWINKLTRTTQVSSPKTMTFTRVSDYSADVRGIFVAYPHGKVIGHSVVPAFENVGLFSSKSEAEHIDSLIKQAAYLIRARFIHETKTGKE